MRAIAPNGHHHPIVAACYAPTFYILITADTSGLICVWDMKTGARIFQFTHHHSARLEFCSLSFSSLFFRPPPFVLTAERDHW